MNDEIRVRRVASYELRADGTEIVWPRSRTEVVTDLVRLHREHLDAYDGQDGTEWDELNNFGHRRDVLLYELASTDDES